MMSVASIGPHGRLYQPNFQHAMTRWTGAAVLSLALMLGGCAEQRIRNASRDAFDAGNYEQSVQILKEGRQSYPGNDGIRSSLILTQAAMFRGGYAFDEALRQCLDLGLGARIHAGVVQAQAALARGQRVSTALGDAGLTDAVSLRLLAVGERTGNFDKVLQTIAQRHAGNFSIFIERATRVAEPLLLLSVALFVGGMVVMMYMPVFDIASSIR